MGDWSSITAIPLPAWLAVGVWLLGSLAIQFFSHRNKQAEHREAARVPSWAEYAEENRKLRAELDSTRKDLDDARDEVDKVKDELTEFRTEMESWRTLMSEQQGAMRRVLSAVAYQAPIVGGTRWRPTLEQRDIDILDDTIPSAWHTPS